MALEDLPRALEVAGLVLITETTNEARLAYARQSGAKRLQWSALLEGGTCPLCLALDGKVFEVGDQPYDPPAHINCRCVWIERDEDEAGPVDWFDPGEPGSLEEQRWVELIGKHGHFLHDEETYAPLRIPSAPDGNDFVFRRRRNPETGQLESVLEWRRPRYELPGLDEQTVQTGVTETGRRWEVWRGEPPGGGPAPAAPAPGAPPRGDRPAGGPPLTPQYRSEAGAAARRQLSEIQAAVQAEVDQLEAQAAALGKEINTLWSQYARERNPATRAATRQSAEHLMSRQERLGRHITRVEAQVLQRWRDEVLFLPAEEASTVAFDIAAPTPRTGERWAEGANDFRRMVRRGSVLDGQTIRLVELPPSNPQERSYCDYDGVTVHLLPTARERSVVHEAGHTFEFRDAALLRRMMAVYDRRTAGEALQLLRDLTGDDSYRPNEFARPDEWVDVYIGKDYAGKATELISVGAELLYAEPGKLASDPEHFDLVWDILRGGSER